MLDFCGTLCRRHDHDRFVISLRARPAVRPALWALYALNYEIARTREVVTDPPLGRIRLQWWREAVDEALRPDTPQFHHEILRILAPYAHTYGLPREQFHALIDAREADMQPGAVTGLVALEDYAAATNLPLLQMGTQICGETTEITQMRDVAAAYGLTGLVRAHRFHTVHGGMVADSAAVAARAAGLLAGAGQSRGLVWAHARMADIYLRRIDRFGPETPPFLLLRMMWR
jgi:phytoene synthase